MGIHVGGNPRSLSFWDAVIQKLQQKLTKWMKKSLSFGSRICLIKSVLSVIPLYFLSLFRMPMGILDKSRKLMRNLLWGGVEGESKVSWVSLDKVCRTKEEGGLGVKYWEKFNKALMGKWRWRLLREGKSLGSRILAVKYKGVVTISSSVWWRDLHELCFVANGKGWFEEGLFRKLGECSNVLFWQEN